MCRLQVTMHSIRYGLTTLSYTVLARIVSDIVYVHLVNLNNRTRSGIDMILPSGQKLDEVHDGLARSHYLKTPFLLVA
jgi:hypothetical protein